MPELSLVLHRSYLPAVVRQLFMDNLMPIQPRSVILTPAVTDQFMSGSTQACLQLRSALLSSDHTHRPSNGCFPLPSTRHQQTGCIDPTHTRPVCVPLPQESLISDIAGRLNMLLHRFVLTRAMGDTPDMSAPRRASTLNLYDFFAAAGADR